MPPDLGVIFVLLAIVLFLWKMRRPRRHCPNCEGRGYHEVDLKRRGFASVFKARCSVCGGKGVL